MSVHIVSLINQLNKHILLRDPRRPLTSSHTAGGSVSSVVDLISIAKSHLPASEKLVGTQAGLRDQVVRAGHSGGESTEDAMSGSQ